MKSALNNLTLLKLGGSLITDKTQPMTPRMDIITQIVGEIAAVKAENPALELILGHGSGSFGHYTAKKYQTREGVQSPAEWTGFYDVYTAARELNQLVYEAGKKAGLPLMPFSLCTCTTTKQRSILAWNLTPMIEALQRGFIPLVYGDVAFDEQYGGTILSTEEIFDHLNEQFLPRRILLAGIEPGIWKDFPQNTQIVEEIHLSNWEKEMLHLQGSQATDVTGGMKSKVKSMLEIIRHNPDCEIQIFSGLEKDAIRQALSGQRSGTRIRQ